jgi:hypothetical protein
MIKADLKASNYSSDSPSHGGKSFSHFSRNPKICGTCSENGVKKINLEVFALHLKKIVIDLATGGCEDRLEITFAKDRTFVISLGLSHAQLWQCNISST